METVVDTRQELPPTIALILCTVSRSEELVVFLRSLAAQDLRHDWELIVVDQNESPDIVRRALEQAGITKSVLHIRCARVSLAYARNVGLAQLRSPVVGFPDDDCEYPPALLSRVRDHHPYARSEFCGICFRFSGDRIAAGTKRVSPKTTLGRVISFSFFLYGDRLPYGIPRFDERLGIGAYFGAAEESDFLLRTMPRWSYLEVAHDLTVRHPVKDLRSENRARSYGRGFGAFARVLLAKGDPVSLSVVAKIMIGPIARGAASLLRLRREEALVHWAGLQGRVEGLLKFRASSKQR